MFEKLSPVLSGKGFPIYTKAIMEISNFYIKDEELLKNKGDSFTNENNEISNYNNIVIEKGAKVDIFCNKEKVEHYQE